MSELTNCCECSFSWQKEMDGFRVSTRLGRCHWWSHRGRRLPTVSGGVITPPEWCPLKGKD